MVVRDQDGGHRSENRAQRFLFFFRFLFCCRYKLGEDKGKAKFRQFLDFSLFTKTGRFGPISPETAQCQLPHSVVTFGWILMTGMAHENPLFLLFKIIFPLQIVTVLCCIFFVLILFTHLFYFKFYFNLLLLFFFCRKIFCGSSPRSDIGWRRSKQFQIVPKFWDYVFYDSAKRKR